MTGYASLCGNWKKTPSRKRQAGRDYPAPGLIFTNSLHFPAVPDTASRHNAYYVFYKNNHMIIMGLL
ncbi:hypothetical protein D6T91_06435 [Salmonella enterica subsp. houtenae]|nr:hypothetical protein [Salmonella enterica]EBJ3272496.1 hypothetical protein [Salmonella enterica]EDO5297161.1 hypothetical protein [Salmonella enterica subsp. houtenae serovar 40:z4,z24:-]MCR5945635.1 hypothetical protein [Salmonella enterica subsp. houtenae]